MGSGSGGVRGILCRVVLRQAPLYEPDRLAKEKLPVRNLTAAGPVFVLVGLAACTADTPVRTVTNCIGDSNAIVRSYPRDLVMADAHYEVQRSFGSSSRIVNPVSLVVNREGQVAVADRGGSVLWSGAFDGREPVAFGRAGTGPGEFGPGLTMVFPANPNEIAVVDASQSRIQRFLWNGQLVDQVTSRFGSGPPIGYGWAGDLGLARFDAVLRRGEGGTGEYPPEVSVVFLEQSEATAAHRLTVPQDTARGLYSSRPVVGVGVDGSGFLVGAPMAGTIDVYQWDLQCRERWHDIGHATAITDEDRQSILEVGFQTVPEAQRPGVIEMATSAHLLDGNYPRFGRIVMSKDEVWVNDVATGADIRDGATPDFSFDIADSPRWSVYSRQGELVRRAVLPRRFVLHALRDGHPIGIGHTEDGTPEVQLLGVPE